MHSIKQSLQSFRLPDDWRSRQEWLTTAHRAARLLRRDVAHATPQQIRLAIEMASRLNPGPWGGEFQVVRTERWRGAVVTWKGLAEGTVVWIHGGAFAFGSPRVYRAAATHLARVTQCRVVLPSYRLAPEHPFPQAHEDVFAALAHWVDKGDSLVVMGDSAGGNLVASGVHRLLQAAEASKTEALKGVALLSPWCDLRPDALSVVQNQIDHSPFDNEDAMTYAEAYLKDHNPSDPMVSPGLDAFDGRWPATYMEWAEDEFLAPDIKAWSEAMNRQGVQTTERVEPSAVHGWQLLPDLLPEAVRSSEALGAWIRARLGLPSSPVQTH